MRRNLELKAWVQGKNYTILSFILFLQGFSTFMYTFTAKLNFVKDLSQTIGAGASLAGLAMAVPFSAEVQI